MQESKEVTGSGSKNKIKNIDSFDFNVFFEKSSGKKECTLNIVSPSYNVTNTWKIDDEDVHRIASFVNIMSSKYCQIN